MFGSMPPHQRMPFLIMRQSIQQGTDRTESHRGVTVTEYRLTVGATDFFVCATQDGSFSASGRCIYVCRGDGWHIEVEQSMSRVIRVDFDGDRDTFDRDLVVLTLSIDA